MKNKTNCLRMSDGGELMNRFAQRQPLRMNSGGELSPEPDDRSAEIRAAGDRTQTYQPMFAPTQIGVDPIEPLQLANGGPSRMHGSGTVPGKGTGDKVKALYEPGEFVVSNDMLDAAPGLREELHGLRGEVLAAKGTTPEQADAKALGYDGGPQGGRDGQPQKLQANGRYEEPVALGQSLGGPGSAAGASGVRSRPTLRLSSGGALDWTSRNLLGKNMVPPPSPMQAMADNLKAGAAPAAPAAPAGPAYTPPRVDARTGAYANQGPAPQRAQPAQARTAYGTGKQVAGAMNNPVLRGAQRLVGGVGALVEGSRAADDINTGNYAGALDHGLRSAASAALTSRSPAALAGGAYLAGTAVGDRLYGKMDEIQRDGVGYVVNKGVRAAGEALGQDWGVDDSAHLRLQGMDMSTSASAPRTGAHNPNQTAATARRTGMPLAQRDDNANHPLRTDMDPSRASLGASRDFTNDLSGRPGGRMPQLPNDLREGVVHKTVDKQGRVTYSGRNVAPGADGTTQMVDGMGRTLKQLDGNNRGYAYSVDADGKKDGATAYAGQPGLRESGQVNQALRAAVERGDMDAVQAHYAAKGEGFNGVSADQYRASLRDREEAIPARGQFGHNKAVAARQAQRNNLTIQRGQDMDLAGRQATAQSTNARLRYDMAKDERAYKDGRYDKGLEQQGKASDMADKALDGLFDTYDGEKVIKRDDLKAQAKLVINRASGGKWGQLTPAERDREVGNAHSYVTLLDSARKNQNNGWMQKLGIDSPDAPLGGLPTPEDLSKGKLERVGLREGVTTPNAGKGDYALRLPGGRVMYLGSDLSGEHLKYLQDQGVK